MWPSIDVTFVNSFCFHLIWSMIHPFIQQYLACYELKTCITWSICLNTISLSNKKRKGTTLVEWEWDSVYQAYLQIQFFYSFCQVLVSSCNVFTVNIIFEIFLFLSASTDSSILLKCHLKIFQSWSRKGKRTQ